MADACGQILVGSGLTVLSHPLMYIKVLIQVGHEPLPPALGRNLFGRPVQQLPGLFAYAKHIIKIDGKTGLYKGLVPRLCAGALGTVVHSKALQVGLSSSARPQTTKEMIARSCATVITHPFHVITLRCMVQFIGRETKYSYMFGSIITVYREEGIWGFFAGLIPRLLADIISLWICNLLAHALNKYAIDDTVCRLRDRMAFLASMVTYPLVLASNLMAVNDCGLAGGMPPYAPTYPSWLDCLAHLRREGNTGRGNSLFFRKLPAGKKYAVDQKRFF
uniref:Mitochondrial carrier homolog 2 n=1 Tax=Cyprinodon variegatus TaxID=28743 RepID=A0A3Q2E5C2_CYPVA